MKKYPSSAVLFEKYGKKNGLKTTLEIVTETMFALADTARDLYKIEGDKEGPRYKMLRQLAAQSYAVARGQSENLVPNFKFDVELLKFMRGFFKVRLLEMDADMELLEVHVSVGGARKRDLLKMEKHLAAAILTLEIAAAHCKVSAENGGPTRESWKAYKESRKEARV